jgi:2-dehydro-3-deoxygluconokinase
MDAVLIGEALAVAAAGRTGPLRLMRTLDLSVAGAESNVAIGLARLGFDVAWTGRVGDDELGSLITERLRAEGIGTGSVRADPAAPTALMLKERRTAGVTRVYYYRAGSAGSRLAAGDIDDKLIAAARVVHLTGITPALSESARGAVHEAARLAAAHGVPVSFDVNYRARLWEASEAAGELPALARAAAIVFAGEDELPLLTGGEHGLEAAVDLARTGPREVVIKRGARGATLVTGDGTVFEHAEPPATTVDPVGAGDAFAAGYLAGFLDGCGPQERLALGCRLGAIAVSTAGDWEGLPRRSELGLLAAEDGTTQR